MSAVRIAVAVTMALLAAAWSIPDATAAQSKTRSFSGVAAYYSESRRLASGERFNPNALTAAHRTLPFGTRVRVTDPKSGRSVIVTINDRGPFNRGRVIDVSPAAARSLHMIGRGVMHVRADVL
jgi:rare lipoprotein A